MQVVRGGHLLRKPCWTEQPLIWGCARTLWSCNIAYAVLLPRLMGSALAIRLAWWGLGTAVMSGDIYLLSGTPLTVVWVLIQPSASVRLHQAI